MSAGTANATGAAAPETGGEAKSRRPVCKVCVDNRQSSSTGLTFRYDSRASSSAFLMESLYTVSSLEE